MGRWRTVAFAVVALLAAGGGAPRAAVSQLPLAPERAAGLTVTPAFEGWYANADGSFSLSFGYFNRNFEETVEIPRGAANFIEPAEYDGDQPETFAPRQHWGVFAVRVPADFGDARVYWTLDFRGRRYSIPGHLRTDWQIDALEGEAGSGNTPPTLRIGDDVGAGPAGVTGPPLEGRVGEPVTVVVWAEDDGNRDPSVSRAGSENVPVTLTWFKHQGPGGVTFDPPSTRVPVEGAEAPTAVVFDAPGDYVIRVRANDASGVAGAGHAQCCWSNGFVKVTVRE